MSGGSSAVQRGRPSTRILVVLIGALALMVVAGGLIATNLPKPVAIGSRLAIEPAAALLRAPGESLQLAAAKVDGAGGTRIPLTAAWSSSHPEIVSVDSAGLVTAKAVGSAQITATADGASTFAFVIVSSPADGVTLVDDSMIAGDPTEATPGAGPSADATYTVPLTGLTPAVGDRLLSTGGRALAGEVVAVAPRDGGSTVTMKLVPLPELLPDLVVDESFAVDPATAEIVPEVARLFDVTRDGTVFTFTAKSNFRELQAQSALAFPRGELADIGLAAAPALNSLFDDCERDGTISDEGPAFWPFTLDDGPTFSVDVNPSVRVAWNRQEKRFVVDAAPRVEVTLGLTIKAAFSVTWECTQELLIFRVPVFGPASFFLTPLIPVGVGFEVGGEITIAQAGFSLKTSASATASIGFACVNPSPCGIVKEWTGTTQRPEFKGSLPSAHDFRFKPSFEAFGFIKAEIGNPILTSLHLEAVEAKIGPKVELDWAPRAIQIADPDYASELKVTLEMGVEGSSELEGIANRLGLGDILAVGTENSVDLGRSPTGTLDTSATSLTPGEMTTAKLTLDPASVELLGVYDVERVVLVRSSGGSLTELASTLATSGSEFEFSFTVPQQLKTSELFAFVVPRFPPGGLFDFEMARTGGTGRLLYFRYGAGFQLYEAAPDGSGEHEIALALGGEKPLQGFVAVAPDGRLAISASQGHLWITNADGTNPHRVELGDVHEAIDVSWSADGSKLLFAGSRGDERVWSIFSVSPNGGPVIQLTHGTDNGDRQPALSPDGKVLAFTRAGTGTYKLWFANGDGSAPRQVSSATNDQGDAFTQWSPDGKRLLFKRYRQGDATIPVFEEIWIINADGTGERKLTTGPVDTSAAWSPDGTKIIYTHASAANVTEVNQLIVMNADGSGAMTLTTTPGPIWPVWVGSGP